MKFIINKVFISFLVCMSLFSCQNSFLSYEEAMSECMKNTETREFYYADGSKGKSYKFDLSCLKGAQLPKFSTKTLDGKTISTDNLLGKINIINFWFKACKPCIAEMPGFNEIVHKYKSDEINYLSISLDEEEDLKKFLENKEFNFLHLLAGNKIIKEKFEHKGGYPATFITDKNLEIVEVFKSDKPDSDMAKEIVLRVEPVLNSLLN